MRSRSWGQALRCGLAATGLLLTGAGGAGAQVGPFVYIPHFFANLVQQLDTATNTILPGSVAIPGVPSFSVVRGDQSLVYVSSLVTGQVTVIETLTNTIVTTIPVGAGAAGLDMTTDGTRLYVATATGIRVVETATNTVVATIPVGGNGESLDVALSPDGTRAIASQHNGNTAVLIDTVTNAVIATIVVGSDPNEVTFSRDGSLAYVSNFGSNTVSVIDVATQAVTATIAVGTPPRDLELSLAGTHLYVANLGSHNISVIDTATNTVVQTFLSGGNQPVGIAFSPDGQRVYVSNLGSNTVAIFDAATNTPIVTLGTAAGPAGLGICADGNAFLAAGRTFTANHAGTLNCTMTGPGTGPVFTGGTLKVVAPFIASPLPVQLGAQGGTIDTQASTAFLSGVISGPGSLTKLGTGMLQLSGANTYSGATFVNQGILFANAPGALSPNSAMNVAAGATLVLAPPFDQTVGSLAGAGDVALILSDLTTGGDGTSTLFSGVISGNGGLTKIGAGTFTLSGANSYFGPTNVIGGTLVVNGSVPSSLVTVADGAELRGNGLLGGLALSGTLAPGNSIGTLNVVGNAALGAGSTYEVEIDAAGNSDLLAAGGTVTLAGGQVVVLHAPGAYAPGTTYTIVTAVGGVTGTFGTITDQLPLLDALLSYLPNSVVLTLQAVPVASLGLTPNQKAVGAGLDSLGGGSLFDALSNLTPAEIPGALDLLSGEIHASIESGLVEESRYLRDAASARIRDAFGAVGARPLPVMGYAEDGPVAAPADAPLAMWGSVLGAWGSLDGDGNAAELERRTGGFLTGVDGLVSDHARLGILAGYTYSSFDVDERASSGSANSVHLGLYGGAELGRLGLRAGAAYSWHFIDTSRAVAFGGFADALSADYDASTAQIFGEAGYRIHLGAAAFEPFANVVYVNMHTDAFTETGGAAALTHASGSTNQTFTTLGVRASTPLGDGRAKLSGMVGWRHAFSDVTPDALFAFAGGAPFTISGAPIARDALALEAALDVKLGDRSSLGIGYSGQIGSGTQDHSASARLTVSF